MRTNNAHQVLHPVMTSVTGYLLCVQVAVPRLSRRLHLRMYTEPVAAASAPIIGGRKYTRCVAEWCANAPCATRCGRLFLME